MGIKGRIQKTKQGANCLSGEPSYKELKVQVVLMTTCRRKEMRKETLNCFEMFFFRPSSLKYLSQAVHCNQLLQYCIAGTWI